MATRRGHSDYQLRRLLNEQSRREAGHHTEPWEVWQLQLLLEWTGDEDELGALSEMLGRTREACRQRYYEARKGNNRVRPSADKPSRVTVKTKTTTTVTTYHYNNWGEDERSEWFR